MSNQGRVFKNSVFLYGRMFVIMIITLYSSRLVLKALGVSDFGLFNLVGGIVSMLGFFNSAMSIATQRFLAYDISSGDIERLKKTFSSAMIIQFLTGSLIIILAETIGLWYVNNEMNFPENRIVAVNIVYQLTIVTFLFSLFQNPYNALIIVREKMSVFSFLSILDALLKFSCVLVLFYFPFKDNLIAYAVSFTVVGVLIFTLYKIYCNKKFKESVLTLKLEREYIKEMLFFSGWNLFGNIAAVARNQGINVVLNVFYGTVVNAAYGITMQVQSAVNMFVSSFQMAINPQILKSYASGDVSKSVALTSFGSKLSFFLILFIAIPILLHTNFIVQLWLGEAPLETVVFIQACLLALMIDVISGSLMTVVQASGKIKWYQIIIGTFIFLSLPISILILKIYNEASYVFYVIGFINVCTLIFRLFFLKRLIEFDVVKYLKNTLLPIIMVSTVLAVIFYYSLLRFELEVKNIGDLLKFVIVEVLITLIVMVLLGLNKGEKMQLKQLIKKMKK